MNEYTKGKLEKCSSLGLLQISGKTVLCVSPLCQIVENIEKREADTERAMLCWNEYDELKAKEKSHDELVAACEAAEKWLKENTEASRRPASLDKILMDALANARKIPTNQVSK